MMRGSPLAVRLAVLLAGVVVIVLLVAGLIVNRAVSRSLDDTLGPRDEQRLALAVAFVETGLERGLERRGIEMMLRRVAGQTGGAVRLVDENGAPVIAVGNAPPGSASETLSRDLSASAGGGALEIAVPSARAPFLAAFNTALLVTGVGAVAALLVAAVLLSRRVTRPLQGVAMAARQLGAGDLGARASGGPDAESAELATAFNGMADRLEHSERLRRRAASDLAHDLATPATVLESQLQAMLDGVVPADATQLEKARAAASALSGVILQLGELTQAEAAPLQRTVERVGLGELATEVVATLDGMLRERGVTASVKGDAVAVADRGQVARALRNVVANAVQHAPPETAVEIEIADEGRPTVRIHDHGPGIDPEDRPYVFERFYRADQARGTRSGSGIGLTVARELVVANGGTIDVESTGPSGTTFRIELARD